MSKLTCPTGIKTNATSVFFKSRQSHGNSWKRTRNQLTRANEHFIILSDTQHNSLPFAKSIRLPGAHEELAE